MKHFSASLAVIAAFSLLSCNNSETATVAGASKDSTSSVTEQNLAKNRSIYKAIESGDSATISGLIADDAVDHQGPNGGDLKGGTNIAHMLTDMHNHVKDLKFDVVADAANGDYVFTLVNVTGTANDNSMGMTAGNKMDDKSVDVVKVKDGKMVEHWGFVDWQQMMKMMPKPMGDMKEKK
jgi:predicted SnoaL-like aldol condensation-catalyzing enzyme